MINAISANTVETFDRVRALELRKEKIICCNSLNNSRISSKKEKTPPVGWRNFIRYSKD